MSRITRIPGPLRFSWTRCVGGRLESPRNGHGGRQKRKPKTPERGANSHGAES